MSDFNDIGISRELDWPRIKKLLTIGLFASVLHLAGDLILGWGVEDDALEGVLQMLSAYTSTSDSGLFAAALLGNQPLGNALRCAWLAIGNVWMFGGLLVTMKKAQRA